MEDVFTYVIVFGLLILFAFVFLSNKEKKKELLLTKKDYSYGSIRVLIVKHGKEIKFLAIETLRNKPYKDLPATLSVEVVLKDRSTVLLELPKNIVNGIETEKINVDYKAFHQLISSATNHLQYFRIVATFADNRKLKSGILTFNKKWNIFTPDTGTYN